MSNLSCEFQNFANDEPWAAVGAALVVESRQAVLL